MSDYQELLRDPRWQKKRLEILQRDEWACQSCGDTESTLVVHYLRYIPKTDPWDYPDDLLLTLCEGCHEQERKERTRVEQLLIDAFRKQFMWGDVERIAKGVEQMKLRHASEVVATAYEDAFALPELQDVLLDAMWTRIRADNRTDVIIHG